MKDISQTPLRHPEHVMRLSQMGSMFPTRLSFMRNLMRALSSERASVTRTVWDIDPDGYGRALYTVSLGGYQYSLFAISQPLDPEHRTDRVIANAWDAAFVLYDGVPTPDEIDRLAQNAPKQEAGRFGPKDLCLSRANKSVRLFAAVSESLKHNLPLPMTDIVQIGYLMRTTAVYGNGKFGLADRSDFCHRPHMSGPFMAEMLTVWLIRHFTHELVEHVGQKQLPLDVKRALGVGNSTGLGMAPFLVSHPGLLNAWMRTRETALARVLDHDPSSTEAENLVTLNRRVMQHLLEWNVPDPEHQARIVQLRRDWATHRCGLQAQSLTAPRALAELLKSARDVGPDFEELTIAWMLEPFGNLIDDLATELADVPPSKADPSVSCGDFLNQIESQTGFACKTDFEDAKQTAQFWYVSQSKLEPRIGQRHSEPGADLESPLDIARRIAAFVDDLRQAEGPLWAFLAKHPQHRMASDRVQLMIDQPYSEIRDNLIAETTHPIDMLRCKLSFFGASKFDPKSRLWTRIALGQGAPLPSEISDGSMSDQVWLATAAK